MKRGSVKPAALACIAALAVDCSKPAPDSPALPNSSSAAATSDPGRETEARELVAEFDRESDTARRIEIVYELAINSTPLALGALRQIYDQTTEPELGEHVVQSMAFGSTANLNASLALLADALRPAQLPELRATAAETLREILKPETLPLWQSLADDADPALREMARAAIEFLSTQSPPPR